MENRALSIIAWVFLIVGLGLLAGALLASGVGVWILGLMGVGFVAAGGGILYFRFAAARRRDWLLQHGRTVQATFQRIEINDAIEVNGANPFVIVASWHDRSRNELYEYRSVNLWFDPTGFVEEGQSLKVYVDPDKPSRYHVDLSFLPKLKT